MRVEDKQNNAEPVAGDENNHSSQTRSVGEEPTQHLTEKELEEALAKTVQAPDGGR